jgi:hypothetical protein
MVYAVEEELVRSNALRAYLIGYLLGLSYEAIHELGRVDSGEAERLRERLQELYPLIEKEFYYFDLDRAKAEIEAWLEVRKQI